MVDLSCCCFGSFKWLEIQSKNVLHWLKFINPYPSHILEIELINVTFELLLIWSLKIAKKLNSLVRG